MICSILHQLNFVRFVDDDDDDDGNLDRHTLSFNCTIHPFVEMIQSISIAEMTAMKNKKEKKKEKEEEDEEMNLYLR